MINFFGKSLVLFHTVLSIAAVMWSLAVLMHGRDYGSSEPRREAVEWNAENSPTKWVRHASEYDRSAAALEQARVTRDQAYVYVKPALDSIQATETFLPNNHLHYILMLDRLRNSPDEIEVRNLKDGGVVLEIPDFGRPATEDNAVPGLKKSIVRYQADLKDLHQEIKKVEDDIKLKVFETKRFTAELTGTDNENMYVQPGLYKLLDMEFKSQSQLRVEMEEIKPYWSKAIEQAKIYLQRREGLEATRDLLAPPKKIEKK